MSVIGTNLSFVPALSLRRARTRQLFINSQSYSRVVWLQSKESQVDIRSRPQLQADRE